MLRLFTEVEHCPERFTKTIKKICVKKSYKLGIYLV